VGTAGAVLYLIGAVEKYQLAAVTLIL
jgi:hypothetical protein